VKEPLAISAEGSDQDWSVASAEVSKYTVQAVR
jgi:hypothetical protein